MKKEMVEKIENEINQKMKLPDKEKEEARKKIFTNIIIAIIAISYFIFLILGSVGTTKSIRTIDFNIFSIILLGVSIYLFEIAYRKDSGTFAMYGIELLVISLATLFLPYVIFEVSENHKKYYLMISSYIGIYYIIKCIYISVKTKRDYLEEISDIRDIVKKEKRKNISKDDEKEIKNSDKDMEKINKEEKKQKEKEQKEEKIEKKAAKKTTKTKKNNGTMKKTEVKEENNSPKKRGRPKKNTGENGTKQSTESIASKTKNVNKKESIKKETQEESKPKKRGRPKKQEVAQKEIKKEEQKNNEVPKKRGRPRKAVVTND